MLSSIADLAKQIFKDDLQSVIIGKYHIYRLTRSLANKDHALDQFSISILTFQRVLEEH
ncbi:MAG: hypothetical protein ACTSUK_03745 [Promethearchaeota archaeon]